LLAQENEATSLDGLCGSRQRYPPRITRWFVAAAVAHMITL
jgi:hypothetical protein